VTGICWLGFGKPQMNPTEIKSFVNCHHILLAFLNQMIVDSSSKDMNTADQHDQEALIKSAFRYLARIFHPDLHKGMGDENFTSFQKNATRCSKCIFRKNLERLNRLVLIAAIHIGDLNNLTIEELKQAPCELESELKSLKKDFKRYETHPAWKFSSKRSYKILESKFRQELENKKAPLVAEIQMLEFWFNQYGIENAIK